MNDKDFDLCIDFETIDELDNLSPFKLKPTATIHICETKVVKGKTFTWSCWLRKGCETYDKELGRINKGANYRTGI